ncbi:hypothetical protein B0T22DRAFT_531754 [Podospora appendiculata]|uniref:DUF3074 domain-containing protein n=1 Tax=Podospora appendiculata TaxID=314037 RepID=A0AAE1CF53_9PEZI|nr:hypothetical protein B0T22DRAFT_531754 [Podospora appendiculata]
MGGPQHHQPFQSLGPLDWEDIESGALPDLLSSTFADAQTLIDSIPAPTATATATTTTGRARSHTDSAVNLASSPRANLPPQSASLQKEWKECKVGAKENPLGIGVWKLAAKDGKGSWFARRSLHHQLDGSAGFDKWKLALEREFAETLARCAKDGLPGTGNIRGIGAERRVERRVVDGVGALEMFLVSARFPGPTTPRDFVTLLFQSADGEEDAKETSQATRKPRQFMLVSRPCAHPDCPPRPGFIRGRYESVEVIREVPIDRPLRRTRSSVDLSRDDGKLLLPIDADNVAKEAILRSAANVKDRHGATASLPGSPKIAPKTTHEDEPEFAIEWLMVTRSDPGGSVPRFMVEKGTPGGITSDAAKFVEWLSAKNMDELANVTEEEEEDDEDEQDGLAPKEALRRKSTDRHTQKNDFVTARDLPSREHAHTGAEPQGFYGMIAGALGAAGSIVANRVAAFATSTIATDSDEHALSSSSSDTSSEHSYVSAEEGSAAPSLSPSLAELLSTRSSHSHTPSTSSQAPSSHLPPSAAAILSQHDKDLRKLEDRRRKAHEKMIREQERLAHKRRDDTEKDRLALAKLKEKHAREMAKQEEKLARDVRRLEAKRAHEERKVEQRRRKAEEREQRADVLRELEKTRAQRDVAWKEIVILKEQVGELQAQNTMLVARLGREGKGG